jgi:hypothetical protein
MTERWCRAMIAVSFIALVGCESPEHSAALAAGLCERDNRVLSNTEMFLAALRWAMHGLPILRQKSSCAARQIVARYAGFSSGTFRMRPTQKDL